MTISMQLNEQFCLILSLDGLVMLSHIIDMCGDITYADGVSS
jgi:hypothetical protein